MTLHEILLTLNVKLKVANQQPLTPEQFNAFIKYINRKMFSEGLKALDQDQGNVDYMSSFLTEASLTLSSGLADKPADYERKGTITANGITVEVLTTDTFDIRVNDLIKSPTASYPIAKFIGDKIEFYPTNLTTVKIEYYKMPTDPIYVYEEADGESKYDHDGSTQFAWPESFHDFIIDMMFNELNTPK